MIAIIGNADNVVIVTDCVLKEFKSAIINVVVVIAVFAL